MCGIVGIFSFNSQINQDSLHKSLQTIIHRGPDSQKVWISSKKNVGLGHTRLSIIDLVSGDQPLTNETQKLHLVVNGEFYDFERQRKELEKKGHKFRTHSDSENAIHLYEDIGTNCLAQLRGEFAFILWDEENQLCFAARDRFGIKPLYYTVFNQTLYLASEVKALFAAGVPAEWDEDSMRLYTNNTLNLEYSTLFKGIRQIPPGHYLIAINQNVQTFKYWDFNYPELSNHTPVLNSHEYIEQLRNKIDEAIRIRLRADVPVGCYLSGGLDSSTVLGVASAHAKKSIPAFTLTFDKEEYNEQMIAKEMSESTGATFYPIPIKQADLANHFIDAVKHGETFFYNGHAIAKYLLSKSVRDAGYKVVLTGEGADELFAGYPHFRIDQLLYGQKKSSSAERKKILAHLKKTNLVSLGILLPSNESHTIESIQKVLGYTPSWLLAALQSGYRMSEVLSDTFKSKEKDYDGFKVIFNTLDVENQLKRRDPVNQSLYLWSKFRLPHYILTILGDRMEMAHSIEGRVPFLDHHVAEFMRDVPVDLKIHEMTEKYLLREAAKPFLTNTVYKRQKHPFLAPPASLDTKQPFHELLQSTLRGSTLASIPFYDRNKVIRLLDKLPKMKMEECITWDPVLMVMLSTCILQEQFKISC